MTAYIDLFQDSFPIMDAAGLKIADIAREGSWSPRDACNTTILPNSEEDIPEQKKRWQLRFVESPPGIFGDMTQRWPVGMMVTMLSLRDLHRADSGFVPL